MTYSNQKTIIIDKQPVYGSDLYTKMLNGSIIKALNSLSPSGVCFWLYLMLNRNGYRLSLSSKDVMKKCGFSRNTCKRVFAELEEKGFLSSGSQRNEHIFHEVPISATGSDLS